MDFCATLVFHRSGDAEINSARRLLFGFYAFISFRWLESADIFKMSGDSVFSFYCDLGFL